MFSRHGDAVVAQHRLEHVLVHAERGGEHAGADVGDAGELEQALHGAVLAEGAVEDREDDVDVGEGGCDLLRRQDATSSFDRPRSPSRSRASRHRPSRSICTGTTSSPVASSASITLVADATEIAFSLERPPRITAMRLLTGSAASWCRSSCRSCRGRRWSAGRRGSSPRCRASPSCSASGSRRSRRRRCRVGDRGVDDVRGEPGARERRLRVGLVHACDVGNGCRRRPARDGQRDRRAGRERRAGLRILADDAGPWACRNRRRCAPPGSPGP